MYLIIIIYALHATSFHHLHITTVLFMLHFLFFVFFLSFSTSLTCYVVIAVLHSCFARLGASDTETRYTFFMPLKPATRLGYTSLEEVWIVNPEQPPKEVSLPVSLPAVFASVSVGLKALPIVRAVPTMKM